ncbi:MAG: fibronectin type III domain-containing protein [Cyclobacteriaceae bacterium]
MKLLHALLLASIFFIESLAQTLDPTFAPFFTGRSTITASVLQPDNKLILAGDIIGVGNTRVSGKVIRLNMDGKVDNTFNVETGIFNDRITAIAIQGDGKILVAEFATSDGPMRGVLVRLNANGSIDNTFNMGSAANGYLGAITLQSDNKIIVAGSFVSFNDTSVRGIVRLNSNGTIDNSFISPVIEQNNVGSQFDLAVQADGKIIMTGHHSGVDGVVKPYFLRLNPNGTLDTDFMLNIGTGPNDIVTCIDFQSDNKIVIGGKFTKFNSSIANRNLIARLNVDGTLDETFTTDQGFDAYGSTIRMVKIIDSDKILVSGNFQLPHRGIMLLNSDGTKDNSFDPGASFSPSVVAVNVQYVFNQSDNKIVTVGAFSKFDGISRLNVARLSAMGELDASYIPDPAGPATIYKSEVLSSGKILVCGDFTFINGNPYTGIARLLPSGEVDNTFNLSGISNLSGLIRTFAIQPSTGKILIGGTINYYVPNSFKKGLALLSPNGEYDNSFSGFTTLGTVYSSDGVYALVYTPEDKFIVGGKFTSVNGTAKINFARLNIDGSLDNTFNIDGTEFVNRIIRIETRDSDGKMILTEDTKNSNNQYYPLVSLANADGSRANSFDINSKFDGQLLMDAIFLPDGKILIGGDFSKYDGVTAPKLVKVNDAGIRDLSFRSPTTYSQYSVSDIYYSVTLNRLFIGKKSSSFPHPTDANYFDVLDLDGNLIPDELSVEGGIESIAPIGGSFLLSGSIRKVGTEDVASIARINLPSTPTGPPTALTAIVTSHPRNVELVWTDNSSNETAFEIQRSVSNNVDFQTLTYVIANTVTFTDHEYLDPSTVYHYRVRGVNVSGQSSFSNEVTIPAAPTAPTSLQVAPLSQTELLLSWIDNSIDESGFEIYRSTLTNTDYSLIHTTSTNVTTYTDVGLNAETRYYYKISAVSTAGSSNYSNEVDQMTLPGAPFNLAIQLTSNNQVVLSWVDNSTTETAFEIFRSEGDNTSYSLLSTTAANATTYIDNNVEPARKYFYKVRAVNAGSSSVFSQEVTVVITDVKEESEKAEVVVYPNPTREMLYIKNTSNENLNINIINSIGQKVVLLSLDANNEASLSCAGWGAGLYLVQTASKSSKGVKIYKQ